MYAPIGTGGESDASPLWYTASNLGVTRRPGRSVGSSSFESNNLQDEDDNGTSPATYPAQMLLEESCSEFRCVAEELEKSIAFVEVLDVTRLQLNEQYENFCQVGAQIVSHVILQARLSS